MNTLRKIDCIGTVAYVATAPFTQERFTFSYAQMVGYNTSHLERDNKVIYYDKQAISWLPRGRNDIVNAMRGDWVFMLDADMEFEPDSLERLIAIMDKYEAPVVSGLYCLKKKPNFPVMYYHNDKLHKYEIIAKWDGNPDIIQVDAVGAGCLLVKRFVFDMVREQLKEDPFDVIMKLGEDFSFFDRLRRVGIGVYVAPQVKFSHLSVVPISYDERNFNPKLYTKPYSR